MSPVVDSTLPAWLVMVIALGTLLLGGSGVAGVMKVIYDRKLGGRSAQTAEGDSLAQRWKSLIEAQTEALIEPLRARLSDLEVEVTSLKEELRSSHAKYWKAISYIRILHVWISRHIPSDIEQPPAPQEISEDI